jgi:serine-type D-Ala-D-Ala carboxypeptidase (penicillin-binding protein 5/6)
MNEYAKRLGMTATHFANSDGLPDPAHYTTARDLMVLARSLVREFPEYYRWYSIREFTWNKIKQQNRNGLLERDPTVDGMKTGHTDSAGFCLVSSANRNGMRLISVVLGSPSIKAREDASAALLSYGYTFYETVKLKSRGDVVLSPRVYLASDAAVPVGVNSDLWVTIGRGDAASLRSTTQITQPLRAPLAAGQTVGELTFAAANGDVVARTPLVALKPVPKGGMWSRSVDTVALWFK